MPVRPRPRRRRSILTPGHWRLPEALERWAVFRLRRAAGALSYEAERALAAAGVRLSEFAALAATVDRYEMSQSALGERIGLDRNGISRLIDELEDEGLLVRREHATDMRRRVVEITGAGRTRLRAAEADLRAVEGAFLGVLSQTEREELRDVLRRLEPPPPILGDLYPGRPPGHGPGVPDDRD